MRRRDGLRRVRSARDLRRRRKAQRVRVCAQDLRADGAHLRRGARRLRRGGGLRRLRLGADVRRRRPEQVRLGRLLRQDLRAAQRRLRGRVQRMRSHARLRHVQGPRCLRRRGQAEPVRVSSQDLRAARRHVRRARRWLRQQAAVRGMRRQGSLHFWRHLRERGLQAGHAGHLLVAAWKCLLRADRDLRQGNGQLRLSEAWSRHALRPRQRQLHG